MVAVADGDVALASGGSGCRGRGPGCCWGAVGRPGIECRRSRALPGGSEAGGGAMVVVDDVVGVVDGGCASVVKGDVAGNGGGRGLVSTALGVV